ncbi:MAG TPA: SEC-C domain-containing protein [Epulopiscium sp.]|nr:SEC-C domain-containing protein [Candidatus Epulonipiscium sp.]
MTLYEQWDKYGEDSNSEEDYKNIVEEYLMKEKAVYDYILSNRDEVIKGKISELGKKFEMDDVEFLGFVDGINDSIKYKYELETLTADSEVHFEIDYERLYLNMLDANAEWLYNLEQWNEILSQEKRKEIKKDYNRSKIVVNEKKIGRNEPCDCGSGKKYKKCCGK